MNSNPTCLKMKKTVLETSTKIIQPRRQTKSQDGLCLMKFQQAHSDHPLLYRTINTYWKEKKHQNDTLNSLTNLDQTSPSAKKKRKNDSHNEKTKNQ